jgi:hypothetical protein
MNEMQRLMGEEIERLQTRMEELEAELAKRPVVWVKVTGGKRRMSPGGWPMLYIQEEVDIYSGESQFEPYTGEQE